MKARSTVRTRIAPTPSGYLHVGNAINFLLAQAIALRESGTILLRIDDLDAERLRPEYTEDIFHSLAWLGITWDEGPRSVIELEQRWSQRHRLARYNRIIDALADAGMLYACTCSRTSFAHCPHRAAGLPLDAADAAWRLRVPEGSEVELRRWPDGLERVRVDGLITDPVVRQRNGMPAYQIASLADDLDHGINLVVRGMDLMPSTACQLFIAHALGSEAFLGARFVHHPLVTDPHGRKLSKSAGATSLRAMREQGAGPEALRDQTQGILDGLLKDAERSA